MGRATYVVAEQVALHVLRVLRDARPREDGARRVHRVLVNREVRRRHLRLCGEKGKT